MEATAPETVSQAVDYGWLAFQYLAPVVLAVLGWASVRLSSWIKAKTRNELVSGMLIRLNESALSVVHAVDQQVRPKVLAARSPDSPGGTKLTQDEADELKAAALDALKAYWGRKGLTELGGVLGLDGEGVGKLLDSKIETAVGRVRNGGGPVPT